MSDLDITSHCTPPPQPFATLWYCRMCGAVISIRSDYVVDEAFCPACVEIPLEFCGNFDRIPGASFGDA
jgi:hypothetical protein